MTCLKCEKCGETHRDLSLRYSASEGMFVGTCPSCSLPLAMEDRGTTLFLWAWVYDDIAHTSFEPMDVIGYKRREVSVPIGWSLSSDADQGVVLVDLFGERLSAADVFRMACDNQKGFRSRTT